MKTNLDEKISNAIKAGHKELAEKKSRLNALEQEKQELAQTTIEARNKVILVVGLTGSGKGTLVNYLSGAKLKADKYELKNEELKLDLVAINESWYRPTINHSTTTSDTFYPNIFSPKNVDYSFIDCPGFEDSRGIEKDIAGAFLRQEVIKKNSEIKEIKILLIIPYSAVVNSEGRGATLVSSMQGLSQLFPNLKDIKDSIVIIFNGGKGENLRQETLKKIDKKNSKIEQIKSKIKQMLTDDNIVNPLQSMPVDEEKKLEKKMEKLKKLEKKIEKLKSIGYSEPLIKAKIDDFIKQTDGKLSVEEKDFLKYIIDNDRFGIFSKPEKEGEIRTEDKEKILSLLLSQTIKYASKDQVSITVKVAVEHHGEIQKSISLYIDSLKKIYSEELVKVIKDKLTTEIRGVECSLESVGEIKNKLEQVRSQGEAKLSLEEFINHITLVWSDIKEAVSGNHDEALKFLVDLLPNGDGEWKDNLCKTQWIEMVGAGEKLATWNNTLNSIIEDSKPEFNNNKIVLKGHFPKVSQLVTELKDDSKGIKSIEIYALNTVIIDENLNNDKVSGVNITIIAPKWLVKQETQINISGRDGLNHKEDAKSGQVGVYNYDNSGIDGESGLPGLTGKSGGHFFGVGSEFYGIEKLNIIANGGKGGPGQNGGNGNAGKEGKDGNKEKEVNSGALECIVGLRKISTNVVNKIYMQKFESKGEEGGKGGKAGKGGEGGLEGYPGSIKIFDIGKKGAEIVYPVESGGKGEDGKVGIFGSGGLNGITYYRDYLYNFPKWEVQVAQSKDKVLEAQLLQKDKLDEIIDELAWLQAECSKERNTKKVEEQYKAKKTELEEMLKYIFREAKKDEDLIGVGNFLKNLPSDNWNEVKDQLKETVGEMMEEYNKKLPIVEGNLGLGAGHTEEAVIVAGLGAVGTGGIIAGTTGAAVGVGASLPGILIAAPFALTAILAALGIKSVCAHSSHWINDMQSFQGSVPSGMSNDKDLSDQKPDQPLAISEINYSAMLTGYKSFLRENLNDELLKDMVNDFYISLENHSDIRSLDTVEGLIGEFISFEQ